MSLSGVCSSLWYASGTEVWALFCLHHWIQAKPWQIFIVFVTTITTIIAPRRCSTTAYTGGDFISIRFRNMSTQLSLVLASIVQDAKWQKNEFINKFQCWDKQAYLLTYVINKTMFPWNSYLKSLLINLNRIGTNFHKHKKENWVLNKKTKQNK